jgi:hypothetical protein
MVELHKKRYHPRKKRCLGMKRNKRTKKKMRTKMMTRINNMR